MTKIEYRGVNIDLEELYNFLHDIYGGLIGTCLYRTDIYAFLAGAYPELPISTCVDLVDALRELL